MTVKERWSNYWYAIYAYLRNNDELGKRHAKRDVRRWARAVDNAQPGIHNRKDSVAKKVTALLKGLDEGNRKVWADFLASMSNGTKIYVDLKAISPFADHRLLVIKFNGLNVELSGELLGILTDDFSGRKLAPGTYVVMLPQATIDNAILNAMAR